jgi:hypothetical protein
MKTEELSELSLFKFETQYDAQKLLALEAMLYTVYKTPLRALIVFGGTLLLVIGVAIMMMGGQTSPTAWTIIIAGSFTATSGGLPPKVAVDRFVRANGDIFPTDELNITAEKIESRRCIGNRQVLCRSISYQKIDQIALDERFFYLMVDEKTGWLIEKSKINKEDRNKFGAFIQKKTGKNWYRKKSLLWFSLGSFFNRQPSAR